MCCENENIECNHNEKQRALTSTYLISEIEYALTLGYKILAIHECQLYTKSSYLLKDFVQKLNFFKTKFSNCLMQCKSMQEKETYCNKLNEKMDLKISPFILTPQNISNNPSKRHFYKLWANSLFGKLSERNDKSKVIFVSNAEEIQKIYAANEKIEDVFCINDSICELHIKNKNNSKLPPNRKTNCLLGAQVTAYARQIIHEHAFKLVNLNYTLFQINTDSIMYAQPSNENIPFELSHAVGDFKIEIAGNVLTYYSFGTKSYSITHQTCSKEIKTLSKVCGLSIQGKITEELLNNELFHYYINQSILKNSKNIKIPQTRFKKDFNLFRIEKQLTNVNFSNSIVTRRIIDINDPCLKTLPYGYKP